MLTLLAVVGVNQHSFGLFFGSYMVIFLLSGAANGSTYRMIPVIFGELGRTEAAEKGLDRAETTKVFKREAVAVIGIAGAIGAFCGFLIQLVSRDASLGVTALMKDAATPARKPPSPRPTRTGHCPRSTSSSAPTPSSRV